MPSNPFTLLVELTRGPLIESMHFGALAVADAQGNLIASCGDPNLVANLRSSAKPLQALPFIERGGAEAFDMTDQEISIICASHAGTDEHVRVLKGLQARIGVKESDLQCGVHPAGDDATAQAMFKRGEEPTPYRHNCSGKHTGMLAHAVLRHLPIENYLDLDTELQHTILQAFAEMNDLDVSDVLIGIDGCSAPTFASPLRNAAMAYARLADPTGLEKQRADALRTIFRAMTSYPFMVSGPHGFDTVLMEVGQGKIVSKGGAEGYQAIGLLPGAIAPDSPAMGITYKVIDGDQSGRARPVIGVEILRQLGALRNEQIEALKAFYRRPIHNWRGLEVGEIRPAFTLEQVAV